MMLGLSFMKKSSAQATYLLFKELCLPDIFVYKNYVKSIKKIAYILRVYLLNPTSSISLFILHWEKNAIELQNW